MQTSRVQIEKTGGPEVIEWITEELRDPGPDEVLIENTAVGLNFIDTYHRSGLYPLDLPSGLGVEGAGKVLATGSDVSDFSEGDRVAYFGPNIGAYATHRVMAASSLFKLPDSISDQTAAAAILKGATVEALTERCASVEQGQTVLVHAAAGGVGQIMVHWLSARGVTVVGTVSSEQKAELAREAGCDHVIRYDHEDIAERIHDITNGAGVPVVFDGVGKDTFEASLDALAPRGLLVSYGNASGPVTDVNLGILAQKGSLFVTRPTLFHYYASPAQREQNMAKLWDMIASGKVRITIGQTYALNDVAQAHRDLENRKTTGSTVLTP